MFVLQEDATGRRATVTDFGWRFRPSRGQGFRSRALAEKVLIEVHESFALQGRTLGEVTIVSVG